MGKITATFEHYYEDNVYEVCVWDENDRQIEEHQQWFDHFHQVESYIAGLYVNGQKVELVK